MKLLEQIVDLVNEELNGDSFSQVKRNDELKTSYPTKASWRVDKVVRGWKAANAADSSGSSSFYSRYGDASWIKSDDIMKDAYFVLCSNKKDTMDTNIFLLKCSENTEIIDKYKIKEFAWT